MKKTTRKLELKRSTIRLLQPRTLSEVGGAGASDAMTNCSDSCMTCEACTADYTLCPCGSVWTYCHFPSGRC